MPCSLNKNAERDVIEEGTSATGLEISGNES